MTWDETMMFLTLVLEHRETSADIPTKTFYIISAVLWADSCGTSTSRRLQAKAVPTESMHKKLPTKIVIYTTATLLNGFNDALDSYFRIQTNLR